MKDKVIVIIGGTGGMGLSAALACAQAGARIVAVGRDHGDAETAQRQLGDAAHVFAADAVDPTTAPRAINEAVQRFGGIDGIYHVAGGSGRKAGDGPLHEISDSAWEFTLQLNLTSIFYSNRAAVRQMMAQGRGGSILNMGSALAMSPAPKFFATHAYTAAKSALHGFIKGCAAYYAKDNIRFNAIVPALVETPMSQRAVGNAEIMKYIATKQPLDGGRAGRPEDLDAAAVFFLSDQSRFVTGQILSVDGGWSVSEGQIPGGTP